MKRAVESGINWKKRYFVLNDHTVTYYKDHKHTAVARGDLLLMPTTTTKDFVKDNKNIYGFTVTTAFKELRLIAKDDQERQEWKQAIHAAVQDLSKSMRGYLYKRAGFLDAWKRKFFVLHRCVSPALSRVIMIQQQLTVCVMLSGHRFECCAGMR